MNRERLLLDAKAQAAALAEAGYSRSAAAHHSRSRYGRAGRLGDRHISDGRSRLRLRARPESRSLGRVHPCRRPRHARHRWSREQYLLDLEREAFLSLCGERKTQERIAFTLKTGKPLRN